MSQLFKELKRRNVFRAGIAYLVAAWLLMQVTDVLAPTLSLPDWTARLVFLLLAVGFVPALNEFTVHQSIAPTVFAFGYLTGLEQ